MNSYQKHLLFYGSQFYEVETNSKIQAKKLASENNTELFIFSIDDCLKDEVNFISFKDKFMTPSFSKNKSIFYLKNLEVIVEKQQASKLTLKQKNNLNLKSLATLKNNLWANLVVFLAQALLVQDNLLLLASKTQNLDSFPAFLKEILIKRTDKFIFNQSLEGAQIFSWTEQKLTQKDVKLNRENIQALIYFCDENPQNIIKEIEKLSLLSKDQPITSIENLVLDSKTFQVFELIQLIITRQQLKAIKALETLATTHDKVQNIFNLLSKELRKLLKIKWLLESNVPMSQVGTLLSIPFWLTKKLVAYSKFFTTAELENIILFLHSNDVNLKYSRNYSNDWIKQFFIQVMKGYFLKRSY